ncbi:MAG: cytochrome c biogenesis protein CcsA [Capsulimonadaceae bacterium]|nr:cytochrome c biogenesis protein CcsA [Capsulimonadaceae bacterium]
MIAGYVLLALALIATITAAGLFVASWRAQAPEAMAALAKRAAIAAAVCVASASAYLVFLIATHQFQVAYVAEYSARRSSARYLLAAFWGGQEGSILLWVLWTSVLGAVLAHRAGGKEARIWPIFAVLQSFLLTLVLVKCPFKLGDGPVPADGVGLNPLLENQWMVIHPPILFLGFASLAFPWVWALYGLIYKDWDGWLRRVFPWALFSFGIHGLGVALGGYWAYETLGWGGFWGWDPVENSSLVPWLFLIALLHGIPIQRANGGYKVSNLLLASLPFAFMCYGTFLTRTGLLADFSVHSFSSLGKDGFTLLLSEVIVAFVLPLTLLVVRFKSIPKPVAYASILTREFGFFLASAVIATIGIITALGMSAPLITKLWLAKGAGAQPEYYNQAVYPLALVMLVAMAVTPYLEWRSSESRPLGAKLLPAYIITIVLTLGMFVLGGRKPWMLLMFAAALFTGLTNLVLLAGRVKRPATRMTAGGIVAHIGVAMLIAGIACLVTFSRQALHLSLIKDNPVEALGYKLTYLGMSSQPYDRANTLRVLVEKDGRSWIASPHLFMAPWEGQDTMFANPPDIRNFAWGDLYLAHYRGPLSINPTSPNNGVTLHQGDSFSYGGYTFNYKGMSWSDEVHDALMSGGVDAIQKLPELRTHALLDVAYQGKVYPIRPEFVFNQLTSSKNAVPAALPGPPNAIVAISDVQLPSTVTLSTFNLPDPYEMVQLDLSTKPMIWLVWGGTLLYTLGGFAAFRRRAIEFAHEEDPAPAPDPAAEVPDVRGRSKTQGARTRPARANR